MISNLFFIALFALMTALGAFTVIRQMRSLRAPREYPDVLLAWSEAPRSDFRADPPSWIALNLHRLTAIGLGVGVLLLLLTRPNMVPPPPGPASLLAVPMVALAGGAVALMGFLWGFVAAGPLAEAIGGDRHYAVSERGFLALGRLHSWAAFSGFSTEADSGLIYIWSTSLRGTVAFLVRPSAPEDRQRLLGILQAHLPSETSRPGFMRKYRFPLLMLAFCAVFVLAAVLLCSGSLLWALLTMPLLLWLFLALGSSLIMRLIFRGSGQPAAAAPG